MEDKYWLMKFFIPALYCLFVLQDAIAQEEGRKIHFGLSLNPQLSFASFNSDLVVENKPSVSLGLSGDLYIDVTPRLQFRTGLSFQRFSLKHRDNSPNFPADTTDGLPDIYKSYLDFNSTYHFIGLPLEIKIKTSDKPNHFFFAGGLHLRYKFNSAGYVDLNESGLSIFKLDPEDFPIQVQSFQPFLAFHVAYQWAFNNNKLSAGPSFEYSIVDIFKTSTSAVENAHLSFIGIRLSYH